MKMQIRFQPKKTLMRDSIPRPGADPDSEAFQVRYMDPDPDFFFLSCYSVFCIRIHLYPNFVFLLDLETESFIEIGKKILTFFEKL